MTDTDAFETMLRLARGGDLAALRDLVAYLRLEARSGGWSSARHASDRRVAYALHAILEAAPPGSPQQREIESLNGLSIYSLMKSNTPLANLIRLAWRGDPAALRDLVRLAEIQDFHRDPDTRAAMEDEALHKEVAGALADIFLDPDATPDQKRIILDLKDTVVYHRVWIEESEEWVTRSGGGEERTVRETVRERRSESLTFMEYVKRYRSSDILRLGA